VYASVTNLVTVTVERYLKVVHPFWSKRYLKRRLIQGAMVFTWISGALYAVPVSFVFSEVEYR